MSKSLADRVAVVEMKIAFWKGVVAGVVATAAFLSGLVALIYYMVQIVQVVK